MPNPILTLAAASARLLPARVKQALYKVEPLARLLRGGLNRAAPQGLTEIQVAAGGLQGINLLLDLQNEKDYWLGTYEPELQMAIAELVRPGMIAYDVGANIGYITLLLARAAGESGRVIAFEALPANLERLHLNLELNEAFNQVTIVPQAVVDIPGLVQFLVGPSGGMGKVKGSAGRQKFAYTEKINVPGTSLDNFVFEQGNPPPQVIKMDIEGGEVLALPGMRRLLQEHRPVVLLELHGPEAANVAWGLLLSCGYQLCRMAPGFPGIPSLEALNWKAYLVARPAA